MASLCIPIARVRDAGSFGASLNRAPVRMRSVLRLYYFPKMLRIVNETLGGETVGELTKEQASELYVPLNMFYFELNRFCDTFSSTPWLLRVAFGWWMRSFEAQVGRLGDIIETLAWASDTELRSLINSAIGALDHQVN